ncbi:putative beta-1,4-xylosyltransferase IRX9H [Acorus gramineus]|uniref:Glycosyltransferases n=1 Tax=Acorus gramineus TaxID=55184 RepID=A0AAV9APM7_ACOGR|nr:putative beta-1,4-xylosyltransferase IRX9H [Acorus gramineus]
MVERGVTGQNGEVNLDSPSLNRSSYTHKLLPYGGSLASFFGGSVDLFFIFGRIRTSAFCFMRRSSRGASERSKPKGMVRDVLIRFFICFIIGIFIGFTPFVSVDFSKNIVSKNHAFSFIKTSMGLVAKQELTNEISSTFHEPPLFQESDLVYRKLLIIVTPTYVRPFQAYHLSRLAFNLRLVPPPLLWIVVDNSSQSAETAELLRKTGLVYRHLVCMDNSTSIKDMGVRQRNVALSHIEKHHLDGIVYFADDDNIYSMDLFEQMRNIRRFGTWPVGMLAENKNKANLEGPVCNGSQVLGWHTKERSDSVQRFHVGMSGFAFNSTILWDPKRWHRPTMNPIRHLDTKVGIQGTTFVEQIVEDESQMEGLANNCSKIMVWHLHLEAPGLSYPLGWSMQKNLEVVAPLS